MTNNNTLIINIDDDSSNSNNTKVNTTEDVKLFPVDIVGDGRCFSGSAFYVLDNECESNFNPQVNEEDSKKLNSLIQEVIINTIKEKEKYDSQVVKWVHKYTKFKNTLVEIESLGSNDSLTHPIDEFFEDKNLSILDGALERISQPIQFNGLENVITKLGEEKENNLKELLGVEIINIENISNFIKLLGVDTVKAKVGSLSNFMNIKEEHINSTLGSLMELLGVNKVGEVDEAVIKTKIEEICGEISSKQEYEEYYSNYIGYIESLNKEPYGWTEPNYGPAEVLADAYNAIINLVPSDGNRNPLYKYPLAKPPVGNKPPKNVYIGMTMPDAASGVKGAGHFWAFVDGAKKTTGYELNIEKVKLKPNEVNVNPTYVDDLIYMGFDKNLSRKALERSNGNIYNALDLLIQQTNQITPRDENLKLLLELEFNEPEAKDALKKHNNNVITAADYLFLKQDGNEVTNFKVVTEKVNQARASLKESERLRNSDAVEAANVKAKSDAEAEAVKATNVKAKSDAEAVPATQDKNLTSKVHLKKLLDESQVKEVAVMLFVNNSDKVVFVRDKKDNKWMFPSGSKKDGESLLDAVNRNYKEETGFNLPGIDFTYLQYHPAIDDDRDVIQIYIGKTKESCPSFKVNNITDKLECRSLSGIFEKKENTSDYKNYVIKGGIIIYHMIKTKIISDDFVVGHTKNSQQPSSSNKPVSSFSNKPVSSFSNKPPSQNRSVTKKIMPPKVRAVNNTLKNNLIMSAYNIENKKHTPFSSNPKRDIALGTTGAFAVLASVAAFAGGKKQTKKKSKRTGTRKHLRKTGRRRGFSLNKRQRNKKNKKLKTKRR